MKLSSDVKFVEKLNNSHSSSTRPCKDNFYFKLKTMYDYWVYLGDLMRTMLSAQRSLRSCSGTWYYMYCQCMSGKCCTVLKALKLLGFLTG